MTATTPIPQELIPTRHSLITRLKDWEDQEGWKQFFDTYSDLIFRVARKAGLREEEAHEVVQETVITVAKNIPNFKTGSEHGSFKGWLLKTTRWRIADQFRKRSREPNPPAQRPAGLDEGGTGTIERIPDPKGPELETAWDREWERHRIERALQGLRSQVSAKSFQIFQMLVTRQLPAGEVAKMLGISRTLVYVTKHRLSGAFKEQLKKVDSKLAGL